MIEHKDQVHLEVLLENLLQAVIRQQDAEREARRALVALLKAARAEYRDYLSNLVDKKTIP